MNRILNFIKDHTSLLLAIFSAYVYIGTYEYEAAYLKTLDVPTEFIKIDLNTVITDSSRTLGVLVISIFLFKYIRIALRRWTKISPVTNYLTYLIAAFWVVAALSYTTFPVPNFIARIITYAVIVLTIVILIVLIVVKKKSKRLNIRTIENNNIKDDGQVVEELGSGGLENQQTGERDKNVQAEAPKDTNSRLTIDDYLFLGFVFILPVVFCIVLGDGEAAKKTTFPVFKDSVKYALIRVYGDFMICKRVDTVNHTLDSTLAIYKFSLTKPVILKEEKLEYFENKFKIENIIKKVDTAKVKRKVLPKPKTRVDSVKQKSPALRQGFIST
ncbi:hypothetical protein KHS38_11835 [Mucilaginibacter sp. Bleaf8]|uniref:hypothetical protein n=1 Tax=Mucilaginibacter sp. Bleaf8 TaxID=2834430 RepID=UPI001BD153E8|nr:hypothetical protein [Mucilaginibacter sp. Bleaf8]MBS7565096.1 hypothetical protein [Mucilaginibacter sp. Bleaf8]